MDDTWLRYLADPPELVQSEAAALIERAQHLAGNLTLDGSAMAALPDELDLVCSGGGLWSMYFLGLHQVLAELERLNKTALHRMSGASGGAEVAFRLALIRDEQIVAAQNLAYAVLQAENEGSFDSFVKGVLASDHHWRLLGEWMLDRYGVNRSRLDGVAQISVTTFEPAPVRNLISTYHDRDQALEAFIMTGSFWLMPDAVTKAAGTYDGLLAGDGGVTDCTPHFSDGARQQLVVLLVEAGLDMKLVSGRYSISEALHAMRKGQDDIIAFLRAGGKGVASLRFADESTDKPCDCDGNFDEGLDAGAVAGIILVIVAFCCCCAGAPAAVVMRRRKLQQRQAEM